MAIMKCPDDPRGEIAPGSVSSGERAPDAVLDTRADERRRKLLRIAATVGPVMLTLRSGPAAASGCVAAMELVSEGESRPLEYLTNKVKEGHSVYLGFQPCSTDEQKCASVGTPLTLADTRAFESYCSEKDSVTVCNGPIAILSTQASASLAGV